MTYSYRLSINSGATVITDDQVLSIKNVRPENNVSSLVVMVDDYRSKNYSDIFDVHTDIDLLIKKSPQTSYTTVFSGVIDAVGPSISPSGGEVLEVQAWGWGISLDKTHCDTSYGVESANPSLVTPEQILEDIIDNHVEKRFGGGNTNWSIDHTDIDAPHADLSVTNITSQYLDNFTLIQRICDLINAHANITSDISVHWMVDTDAHFRMKEIDQDSTDSAWTRYYGGSAAAATFTEGENNISSRGFSKNISDYANHVLVAAGYRYPATDRWTESLTGWADDDVTLTVDTGGDALEPSGPAVGSYMLKALPEIDGTCYFYYDFPAVRDFTKIGSQNTIPKLGFYLASSDIDANVQIGVNLYETRGVDFWSYVDQFAAQRLQHKLTLDSEWQYVEIPFGPYSEIYQEEIFYSGAGAADTNFHWTPGGAITDWTGIAGIEFQFDGTAGRHLLFVDDIHFSGKLVRSCYDASSITASTPERQVLLRMESAVDDTLKDDDDDAGMAAMLAVSELYRRLQTPTVGIMEFPLKEDMLPGQTLVVYAGKKLDGTYRWSGTPMRIKEIVHLIDGAGFRSQVNLTSDVTNTFAHGVTTMWDQLMDYAGALRHGQAKDLKVSGIDNLIPRLAWDPT